MASGRRWPLLVLSLATSLSITACGDDPPDREIQQAQTAVDAAKASGAGDYAHDEFAGAEDALKRARAAVTQRDYRLALTNALDSRERALTATAQTAEQKNVAKSDAGREMAATLNALAQANAAVKAAEAARAPASTLREARKVIADTDRAVQEAGTAFQREEFLTVKKILNGSTERLSHVSRDLNAPAPKPARRKR